jgi:hypothetical protein
VARSTGAAHGRGQGEGAHDRGRPPPPQAGEGRGERGERGERREGCGGGGGRNGEERGATGRGWTARNEENWENNEIAHRRRQSSPEPRRKLPIHGEPEVGSINRKHRDEALDETNAVVLSYFTNDARIESNCLPELESPRTSVSNSGNCGSNLGRRF